MSANLDLMHPKQRDARRLQLAPRCTATSKRSRQRCQCPAVRGSSVCRMHGALGGGPKGSRNGRYLHGMRCAEFVTERRALFQLLREAREFAAALR